MADTGPSHAGPPATSSDDPESGPRTKKGFIADCVNLMLHCHHYSQLNKPYPSAVTIETIRIADRVRRLQSGPEISRFEASFRERYGSRDAYQDPGPSYIAAIANSVSLGPGSPDDALDHLLAPLRITPNASEGVVATEATLNTRLTLIEDQLSRLTNALVPVNPTSDRRTPFNREATQDSTQGQNDRSSGRPGPFHHSNVLNDETPHHANDIFIGPRAGDSESYAGAFEQRRRGAIPACIRPKHRHTNFVKKARLMGDLLTTTLEHLSTTMVLHHNSPYAKTKEGTSRTTTAD